METKQTEVKQTEPQQAQPQKAPKKPRKNPFRSNKFKRGGMATLMTVVFIAIVVVLNVVVSALTERFPSMDIDLTAQGLNTLSEQALEIAKGVEQDTTIYLIGSEDAYENNQIYSSYGLEYSQVANLAKRLAEANSKIKVEFVDPDTNPTFISEYAEDNLATGKVLVKTEKRHRVLGVADLFSLEQDQTTGAYNSYSLVVSALAAALEVVNLDEVPVFTIATGHGEMLTSDNMGSFLSMMEDQNFEVKEIDLLTEEIPEGTQVLMLPTPTTDYSPEEVNKLRAYLDDTSHSDPVTLLATCYPSQTSLPNYAAFLEEWGVKDGSKEEVLSYFEGIHPRPRQMLDKPTSWRRWSTADREPVAKWGTKRITLVGDAAHPVAQYMAQGACMALEDAVTLGKALAQCEGDAAQAFALYESVRIPRTARIVWSTREMGRVYHAAGVERQVRNLLWKGKSQAEFYRGMEWLYGWKEDNCLQPR